MRAAFVALQGAVRGGGALAGPLLELLVPSVCPLCDAPRRPGESLLCGAPDCALPALGQLGAVATCFGYRGAGARLIQRLKFEGRRDALDLAAARVAARIRGEDFDGIVPVPRHPRRVRRLGCDPVYELARRVARLRAVPLWPSLLRRSRDAPPQTELEPVERWRNAADSFRARRGALRELRPLLLDDVTTTGATLHFAALALVGQAGSQPPLLVAAAGTPLGAGPLPSPGALGYNGGPTSSVEPGGAPTWQARSA